MPFDYPGDYLMRFDDIDVGCFRKLVVIPMGGRPLQPSAALATTGPGTIVLHELSPANPSGDLLLHRWQWSPTPTGTPPNVGIAMLDHSGSAIAKWMLRDARPVKWDLKPLASRSPGGIALVTVTLTIVHRGFLRIE